MSPCGLVVTPWQAALYAHASHSAQLQRFVDRSKRAISYEMSRGGSACWNWMQVRNHDEFINLNRVPKVPKNAVPKRVFLPSYHETCERRFDK